MTDRPALIADVGGTHARFALSCPDRPMEHVAKFDCAEFPSLAAAGRAWLETIGHPRIDRALIAVASPVQGDSVTLTNNPWSFSQTGLARDLGIEKLEVLNDFEAQAYALPYLDDDDLLQIGGGTRRPDSPMGVLGPGTGLGVAILVPSENGDYLALSGEGGHVTMAPTNDEESAILEPLRRRFGHVSAERVISGQGLENLYQAIGVSKREGFASFHEREGENLPAREISARALKGDKHALKALSLLFAMLGTVSGNLALTAGTQGGIFISGGIIGREGMRDLFVDSQFRERFEAKGRFRNYLANIPTYLIVARHPALIGLSALIRTRSGA